MTTVSKPGSEAAKKHIGLHSSNPLTIPGLEHRRDGWAPKPDQISATPGGTMWAMTPGGSKLQWSRTQLMYFANSPLSKSPLSLPRIPGVTVDEEPGDEMDLDGDEFGYFRDSDEDRPKVVKKDEDDVFGMDQ